MFVNSKHAEEEFDHTFGANKRVFKFPEQRVHTEQLQESYLWDEELRAQIRNVHIPAELDFHLSSCRGDQREALSRCGAPSAEEGFAVAGIKNASSVRRVTFPRAEPAVDQKEPVWRTAAAYKSHTLQAH